MSLIDLERFEHELTVISSSPHSVSSVKTLEEAKKTPGVLYMRMPVTQFGTVSLLPLSDCLALYRSIMTDISLTTSDGVQTFHRDSRSRFRVLKRTLDRLGFERRTSNGTRRRYHASKSSEEGSKYSKEFDLSSGFEGFCCSNIEVFFLLCMYYL